MQNINYIRISSNPPRNHPLQPFGDLTFCSRINSFKFFTLGYYLEFKNFTFAKLYPLRRIFGQVFGLNFLKCLNKFMLCSKRE